MNKLVLSLPTLGFVVGTRAALGVGIGLLLSGKMTGSQRRAVGVTVVAIGLGDDDSGSDGADDRAQAVLKD